MISNQILLSEIEFNRIESEYYKPQFVQAKDIVGQKTLASYGIKAIHPAEVQRKYSDSGQLKIVLAQNVRDNYMDWSTEKFMDKQYLSSIGRNKLYADDVLVTRSGANFGQTTVASSIDLSTNHYACADVLILKPGEIGGALLSTYLNIAILVNF